MPSSRDAAGLVEGAETVVAFSVMVAFPGSAVAWFTTLKRRSLSPSLNPYASPVEHCGDVQAHPVGNERRPVSQTSTQRSSASALQSGPWTPPVAAGHDGHALEARAERLQPHLRMTHN